MKLKEELFDKIMNAYADEDEGIVWSGGGRDFEKEIMKLMDRLEIGRSSAAERLRALADHIVSKNVSAGW